MMQVFPGRVGNTPTTFFEHEGEAFPMTENIDHKNAFDKVAMTLEGPRAMHEACSELAGFCGDLLESDHPGADFASVGEVVPEATCPFNRNLMVQVTENRDDGACSIRRDGRFWYRLPPSRGTFHCLFGKVEYWRSRYRNSLSGKSIGPTDESLGLLAGRMATRLVAEMLIRTSKDIFGGFVGWSPAVST